MRVIRKEFNWLPHLFQICANHILITEETEALDERQNTEETEAKEKFIDALRPEEKQEHGSV